ncbi:MAG: amino acid ABC transporter ATP-binding protein [Actinomycetota bacterium]
MGGVLETDPGPPVVVDGRNLTKWFGSFCALDDVSLQVRAGEVIALIGPSGAGKSTLLRCINGLETPTTGRLDVFGIEVCADRYLLDQLRPRIGMVFQHFNLFPQLTVANNVNLAQRIVHHRTPAEARQRTSEALDRVGMGRHAAKHPDQLSGGEQQRVAIARALAVDPDLVLFDEPTASIDPELTKGIVDLMTDIADDGVTIIAVTHEIGFARAVADRMLYLDGGRIIEEGHPDDLLWHARDERTQQFVRAIRRNWTVTGDDAASPWAPPQPAG